MKLGSGTCMRFSSKKGLQLTESQAQVFPCEFWEFCENTFFCRTPPVAASGQTHVFPDKFFMKSTKFFDFYWYQFPMAEISINCVFAASILTLNKHNNLQFAVQFKVIKPLTSGDH